MDNKNVVKTWMPAGLLLLIVLGLAVTATVLFSQPSSTDMGWMIK